MIKGNFGENKNKLFLKDFRWNSWRKCMVERERYQPVTLDRKKKKKGKEIKKRGNISST